MSGPRRRWWVLWVAVAAMIGVGIAILVRDLSETRSSDPRGPGKPLTVPLLAGQLYIPDASGDLVRSTRYLRDGSDLEAAARAAIAELIAASGSAPLPTWPRTATLLDLFIAPDGVAYANFAGSLRYRMPPGDQTEWLIVASLTRTLCGTFAGIRGVRVMIDGQTQGPLRRALPLDRVYRPEFFTTAVRMGEGR